MTVISALNNIHIKGSYGDYKDKNSNDLIKITEKKNLIIVQIVQYKTSSSKLVNLDGLSFNDKALNVSSNDETRILWTAPKSWILTSVKTNLEPGFLVERTRKNLLKDINKNFNNSDYAITDLSHSRAIIELEGKVGRVLDIRLRTTRAVTVDNKVLVIPNHLYLTNILFKKPQQQ